MLTLRTHASCAQDLPLLILLVELARESFKDTSWRCLLHSFFWKQHVKLLGLPQRSNTTPKDYSWRTPSLAASLEDISLEGITQRHRLKASLEGITQRHHSKTLDFDINICKFNRRAPEKKMEVLLY